MAAGTVAAPTPDQARFPERTTSPVVARGRPNLEDASNVRLQSGMRTSSVSSAITGAPRISVVVPAYNAGTTIDATLESLVRQRLAAWEAVVVDDGSTDATLARAMRWATLDARIRVLRHEGGGNRGRAASRNLALAAAKTDLVAFLDADDLLEENGLASYLDAFARWPTAGVVYGQAEVIAQAGSPEIMGRGLPDTPVRLLRQLARFNILVMSATSARRSALPAPAFRPGPVEDWVCWLETARNAKFVFLARVVARYRRHANNSTANEIRALGEAGYWASHAGAIFALLENGSAYERRAARSGLRYRAAWCLLRAGGCWRHGNHVEARSWYRAARAFAPSTGTLLSAVLLSASERYRVARRLDPPLSLDRFEP